MISGAVLGAVLIIVLLSYLLLYRYVSKWKGDVIADHIFIGQVEVSGMSSREAKEALEAKIAEYGVMTVNMKVGEQSASATLAELGIGYKDVDALVEEAVDYGKTGSIWARYLRLKKLEKENKVFEEEFVVDQELSQALIEERVVPLEPEFQNASIKKSGDGFEITDAVAGKTVDAEKSIAGLESYLNEKWEYQNIEFAMTETEKEPEIQREDLETIQDELGSYSTVAGSGTRVTNLKRGAELLNGIILMPGEELSVLEETLPYTEENGYVDGGAYENGQVVQSIAGGICQVSTTLYNAVLYAELEVTERSAHSMIVNYVDPSRDAAVAEGVKDFKFKNNYDTAILIEGYVDGSGNLQFHIYGKETRAESHSVEYESETLQRTEYTKKYVEDSGAALGTMNQEGSAINGRKARLWKVVYENGKEVSRDVINNSTYKATEVTVKVGTASSNAEASELVKQAIASQDEAKIKAAAEQAKALESGETKSEEQGTQQ